MFFNSHLHKGRELGHSIRALLTSACVGTGWFDDADLNNAVPKTFFEDLYIRIHYRDMRPYDELLIGWPKLVPRKKGACIAEAFEIIDPTGQLWQSHITSTASLADEPELINGREAATTSLG